MLEAADDRDRRRRASRSPTSTASSRRPATRRSEELAANLGIDDLRLATTVHMGGASPTASLQHAALAVQRGHRAQRARRRRLERLLGVPAPRGRAAARGAGIDAGAVADVVARLLPAVRRALAPRSSTRGSRRATSSCTARCHTDTGEIARHVPRARAAQREGADARHAAHDGRLPRVAVGVSEPFRLFDCCLETDCAAAVVVTLASNGRATSPHPPAVILGGAEGHPYPADDIANRARPVPHRPHRRRAARVRRWPACAPHDMDFLRDLRLLHLRGAAAARSARPVRTRRGRARSCATARSRSTATLPTNTHGGLLSQGHMWGMNHVVEAVRQLRGDAGAAQVAERRARAASPAGATSATAASSCWDVDR